MPLFLRAFSPATVEKMKEETDHEEQDVRETTSEERL